MTSIRQESARKFELLERYRALRLEEMLADLRPRAESEAEHDRWAWRGEFRTRQEIQRLYRKRTWMDRRFMVDMIILVALLMLVLLGGRKIIRNFVPRPSFEAPAQAAEPAQENGG